MLSQEEANRLLEILKKISNKKEFDFPAFGQYRTIELISEDGKEEFIIDVNRKGYIIKTNKCTYQNRYRNDIILLRLDINGPDHTNPDGERIKGSHLHIYKEGFGWSYAYPIPEEILSGSVNLIELLINFLNYCKVVNLNDLTIRGGLF